MSETKKHIDGLLREGLNSLPPYMYHLTQKKNSSKIMLEVAKSRKTDGYFQIKNFYKPISKIY